jgi:hypothetical protein
MSPEMNNKEHDEILDSLRGMKRAVAPEFFYTRLRARMEQELETASIGRFGRLLTKPALSLGLAGIILLLNITTIMKMVQQPAGPSATEASAPVVIADYSSIDTYPVYDDITSEP